MPRDFHTQYWTEENPDAYFPRPRGYVALSGTNRELTATNDRYMQNIRYCRLKNLTVGYTLPKKWLAAARIQKVRFYVNTYNLFSIDNVKKYGVDPEISDRNGMQYPQNRVVNIGANLTF